ncbi:hypothetical protein AX15_007250 [Amanita polypyramis BW_CC]|nr:hypothetical protein AX15_007250 [Amanita polypyramis BW_CC]
MRSLFLTCLSFGLLLLSSLPATHARYQGIALEHARRGYSKVASAWFAGWHATSNPAFPISGVSWSKYTHMTWSFAETTPDVTQLNLTGSNPDLLPKFVETAHKHGVKVLVSIGGWSGSRWWSSSVRSAYNRRLFVKTVTKFAKKYNLDGLDFDWEYPGLQGVGCNLVNPQDSANFLAFLQELRSHPDGAKLILTAATQIVPFRGVNGQPSTNVAGFAHVLDWAAIMNYDVWGPWSPKVGPNAPLDDSCAEPANRIGSAMSAVKAWHAAGFPYNRLVLGVASYGHSFRVKPSNAFSGYSLASYPQFDSSNEPVGDAWDDAAGVDVCGNPTGPGGNVNFWGLVSLGYLNNHGKPQNGIAYKFDDCSKTAYVYNKTSGILVSYDDAKAFSKKGNFIKSIGIRGFSMWEAGGDHHDILLDSIRKSIGL